jgi:hypothetical protein
VSYIGVATRNTNRQISSEFVYIALSNQQKIICNTFILMIYHLNKETMFNDKSDLVCRCRVCDHEFAQQCSDSVCECCTLEDHVKGSNAEDATEVFPGGSI